MKFIKIILLLIVIISTLFEFTACSFVLTDYIPELKELINNQIDIDELTDNETTEESTDLKYINFTIGRFIHEKLDPYTSQSRTNHEIMKLCYDPLIYIDQNFNAVPVLANNYEINNNSLTFYIKNDVTFYDNTSVTAYDCEYSFRQAKKDASIYKNNFKWINSFEVVSEKIFRIEFNNNSPYNINLMNIPIIKNNSAENNFIPIGAGRYYLSQNDTGPVLKANKGCAYPGEYLIDEIKILDIQDTESLTYNFNYGYIHAMYADLSEGNSQFRGNIELIDFGTNSLVFIGVNRSIDYLKETDTVKGINYAINRTELQRDILADHGKIVWHPLNPFWSVISEVDINTDIYSTEAAHQYFQNANISLRDTTRIYKNNPIVINILVNRENSIKINTANAVANDLRKIGFSVNVNILKWDEYIADIEGKNYELYIGEILLPANMDFTTIFKQNGAILSEYDYSEILEDFTSLYKNEISVIDFITSFQTHIPFIPLYYNANAIAINRRIINNLDNVNNFLPSDDNIYNGIENWKVSN